MHFFPPCAVVFRVGNPCAIILHTPKYEITGCKPELHVCGIVLRGYKTIVERNPLNAVGQAVVCSEYAAVVVVEHHPGVRGQKGKAVLVGVVVGIDIVFGAFHVAPVSTDPFIGICAEGIHTPVGVGAADKKHLLCRVVSDAEVVAILRAEGGKFKRGSDVEFTGLIRQVGRQVGPLPPGKSAVTAEVRIFKQGMPQVIEIIVHLRQKIHFIFI